MFNEQSKNKLENHKQFELFEKEEVGKRDKPLLMLESLTFLEHTWWKIDKYRRWNMIKTKGETGPKNLNYYSEISLHSKMKNIFIDNYPSVIY